MLRVENLSKTLGDFSIVDISFEVLPGEYFVLLGSSGVGKSILLETIAGFMTADKGSIKLGEKDITREKIQNRRIALVYQDQALFPHLSVHENIAYGLRCRHMNGSEIPTRVARLAQEVGAEKLLERSPDTLSGGETQRVALARALATNPQTLLLDEPLAALDSESRTQMRGLLRKLHRQGLPVLHVTHDYQEAVSLASRVAILEKGQIAQIGTPGEIFRQPKSEFVAGFIGVRNFFAGELRFPNGRHRLAEFRTLAGPVFQVLTNRAEGPGFAVLGSEDITISNTEGETSARNTFQGLVSDLAPAMPGIEVSVDVGVDLSVMVSAGSVEKLGLQVGKKIWVSFKASAVKYIEE
jgi:molybdopterin-binding protein